MRTSIAASHRALVYVLFYLFEMLLIASVVVLIATDPRAGLAITYTAGTTFWFAFVGLFTLSLILRKAARRLAVIGWVTLFIGFWSTVLFPVV